MSRRDRQRLSIFGVLFAVLALTLVLGYRMNRPTSTAAVQSPETKQAGATGKPSGANDARIRLDIVENPDNAEDIGQKNLFQYGQRRTPAAGGPAGQGRGNGPGGQGGPPSPEVVTPPAPVVPAGPPPPPPPPPIPFRFTGFAVISSSLTAFLTDDDTSTRHFNVTAGEVLMGRYRITQITDKTVEIEDTQFNRRQVLPIQK